MGRDGAKGLASLKEKQNCFCLVQSEKTCVVYGMPQAAKESGLADTIVDLKDIAGEIERFKFSPRN
jgi:two-component system chemotaxis response regulator CheB